MRLIHLRSSTQTDGPGILPATAGGTGGNMAALNAAIQPLLEELVADGDEAGLQVAAYQHGELILDAWAGLADVATGRRVDGDTLFTVFSCSKGITATVIHLLAERGKLDYDAPVARYWPEFGVNGKAGITVRQVLSHTAGVPHLPAGAIPADLCDWDAMCRAIAAFAPAWQPGTQTGYHARSFGYILGELARRSDGRPFPRIVEEEIARPLGIDSLYFGIPEDVAGRVAELQDGPPAGFPPPPPDALYWRVFPPAIPATAAVFNRPDLRRACIPSSGGIMNARALARHYAALIGQVDGVRLLPPQRLRLATQLQTAEVDLVTGVPMRKGLGYMLGGPLSPMGDRLTAFGHPGSGGSIGFADPEHGLAVGFAKTLLRSELDPRRDTALRITRRVRTALGIPEGTAAPA